MTYGWLQCNPVKNAARTAIGTRFPRNYLYIVSGCYRMENQAQKEAKGEESICKCGNDWWCLSCTLTYCKQTTNTSHTGREGGLHWASKQEQPIANILFWSSSLRWCWWYVIGATRYTRMTRYARRNEIIVFVYLLWSHIHVWEVCSAEAGVAVQHFMSRTKIDFDVIFGSIDQNCFYEVWFSCLPFYGRHT